ncbi:uncharacterized protein BO80DRAFT_127739 [Aspergillus ibericus CBS 121593]|uniref:F-box domain-containing protein n=1 Tax=Aspergillus ibericus CBS 121593 TaxID=1448316 RepID=A0A395GUY6_9EURO|nr:hypothetical protein BO80DRAFT_127739 [Aspergillus ibericus CBS 121593]RAK99305.1 hypothetical protein BO80DRAFT_127739 [Aspergillus ibericus CBS 121593]
MLAIDSLPLVILRNIPQFVLENSWQDLSALSQTSQAWYDLTVADLYKNLRVKFRDLASLQRDVSELRPDGLGRQYLRYAQNLDIVCLEKPWIETKKARRLWQKKDWANEFVIFKPPASQDTFLQCTFLECPDPYLGFLTSTNAYYQDNDWEPIIALISQLQNLRLLNYVVTNMFPTSLYQALERLHPTCQLNIWTSQSPSLNVPGLGRAHACVENGFEQPFDLSILPAPTLHTFHAVYTLTRSAPGSDQWVHHNEPFSFIFMAPNLKHLIIQDRSEDKDNSVFKVKEEWKRFISESRPSPAAVSLDSLTFNRDACNPVEQILVSLSTMIDLSTLRSLAIGVHSDPSLLIQAAPNLVGLERLYIDMIPTQTGSQFHWRSMSEDATWLIEDMISAVQAFRPLRFLSLRGLRTFSSLDRILSHHPTLEGLSLETSAGQRDHPPTGNEYKYPISSGDHIRSVATSCPQLAELRLPLQRTQGNAHECNIYRALGQLSRLHTVILDIDCDLRPRTTGELPRLGYLAETLPSPTCIRETLINAAIDETLVRSIFNLIFSHQETRRLKHLHVDLVGSDMFKRELEHVIRQIGGSFLATRSGVNEVEVKEIGSVAWQLWREDDIDQEGSIHIPKVIKDILEEFWPLNSDRNRSKKWREMPLLVKSFPLEDGAERTEE